MSGGALVGLGEGANSRSDFVRFLEALSEDFRENGNEWENRDLGDFLAALASWGHDSPGYYRNMNLPIDANQPQWRVFADMLIAARVYE